MGRKTRSRCLRFEPLESRAVPDGSLVLATLINGTPADLAPGPVLAPSPFAERTYEVTNQGESAVANVKLVDERGTPQTVNDDFSPQPIDSPAASSNDLPALGTVEKTFNIKSTWLLMHPHRPVLYVSVPDHRGIAIVNTDTLAIENIVTVGDNPRNLALSPDGSLLHVIHQQGMSEVISTVDLRTMEVTSTISRRAHLVDLAVGLDGRLFVLDQYRLHQLDATSGDPVGPVVDVDRVTMEASPQGDRLYFDRSSLSRDVSTVLLNPGATADITSISSTSWPSDSFLAMSADGNALFKVIQIGQSGNVVRIDTTRLTVDGRFSIAGLPRACALSSDGRVAYFRISDGRILAYETKTFSKLGETDVIGTASTAPSRSLITSANGQRLFAVTDNGLVVVSTGRHIIANIGDTNANLLLDPGETWKYTAKTPVEIGRQQSTATVVGIDDSGSLLRSTASSYFVGRGAAIGVDQSIQGEDADWLPGPAFQAATELTWRYTVNNRGSYVLSDVVLRDDNGTPGDDSDDWNPTYIEGDANENGRLEDTETWRFERVSAAKIGQYQHQAVVSAQPVDSTGQPLSGESRARDRDVTNYSGYRRSLQLTVTTNGQPSDASTGPEIPIGERVIRVYRVINSGSDPVKFQSLRDDNGTPSRGDDFRPKYLDGDVNRNNFIDPDEVWTFMATAVAEVHHHSNSAVLYAEYSSTEKVEIRTEFGYFGVGAAISALANVAGSKYDAMLGPLVRSGADLAVEYVVENHGSYPLAQVTVVDDHGTPEDETDDSHPRFVGGDANGNGLLDMAEQWQFTATTTTRIGSYAATVRVSGVTPAPDTNPTAGTLTARTQTNLTYFGAVSDLRIAMQVNGQHAAVAPGPLVDVNEVTTRTIVLQNTGNIPFTVPGIWDTRELPSQLPPAVPSFLEGDTNHNGTLDPDETWLYYSEDRATGSEFRHQARVAVVDLLGDTLERATWAHYRGVGARIQIEAQALDSDGVPSPSAVWNQPVVISYVVTNPGDVKLSQITVVDDHGTGDGEDDIRPTLLTGDTDNDGLLAPGEEWVYRAEVTASRGDNRQVTAVSAVPVDSHGNAQADIAAVRDTHVLQFFGLDSTLGVDIQVNDQSSLANTPLVALEEDAKWEYSLTNKGNVPLTDLRVTNDLGTPATGDDVELVANADQSAPVVEAAGILKREFLGLEIADFVVDDQERFLYASLPKQQSVAMINMRTLAVDRLLPIGAVVSKLAVSPDGKWLCAYQSLSDQLLLIDLSSGKSVKQFSANGTPNEIALAADGTLYVLNYFGLTRIDPISRERTSLSLSPTAVDLLLDVDVARNRLYLLSRKPSYTLTQFDIGVNPPKEIKSVELAAYFSDEWRDLEVSHDGTFLLIAPPDWSAKVWRISTENLIQKSQTSATPDAKVIAIGPDDSVAYLGDNLRRIHVLNTKDSTIISTFEVPNKVDRLHVDPTGRFLFTQSGGRLLVYTTGQAVSPANPGDVDFDGVFDPGETWRFSMSEKPLLGNQSRNFKVVATNQFAQPWSLTTEAHYLGSLPVVVPENVSGALITSVPSQGARTTVSDRRFEVVDGALRLKAGQSLSSEADPGVNVIVSSELSNQPVAWGFVLQVAANDSPWRNAKNSLDTNNDNVVSPIDVLLIINSLNSEGTRRLPVRPSDRGTFLDCSGDNYASPLDALLIVNHLNGSSGESPLVVPTVAESDEEAGAER